jgi:hypothetical protein
VSLRRFNPRRDGNECELIGALEKCGFAVDRISGAGIPDLLVSRRGQFHVVEVKMPKGRDKPAQIAFRDRHHAPVHRIVTLTDVQNLARLVP